MVSLVSDDEPTWRTQLEQSLLELQALGQQVSQKVGDVAKDAHGEARKAWHELEPRLGEAETKLREATDDAALQLQGMFGELKSSLSSLRDKL